MCGERGTSLSNGNIRPSRYFIERTIALITTRTTMVFRCPFSQTIAEKCRISPRQLPPGRRDTPRGTVRGSPIGVNGRYALRASTAIRRTVLLEQGKSRCAGASSAFRKYVAPSTESCSGLRSHASAYKLTSYLVSVNTAKVCELACVRMMASTGSCWTPHRGCGKDLCCHRFDSMSASPPRYTLCWYAPVRTQSY